MAPDSTDQNQTWRTLLGWVVAGLIAMRAVLPMGMMLPAQLSEMTICGAHGTDTLLVDQYMNVVEPDAVGAGNTPFKTGEPIDHCGACLFVFAFVWSVALILSLVLFAPAVAGWSAGNWRQLAFAFSPGQPRAPPLAA